MCEILYLQSDEPFKLSSVLPYVEAIEKYGIAGFGWGAAWTFNGILGHFRSEKSIREDAAGRSEFENKEATSCLFHLRRPSFLSTISVKNSQPYLEPGQFAFAHNGYLENSSLWKERVGNELKGDSDSEIGFLLYKKYLETMSESEALTKVVNDALGNGDANIVVLKKNGEAVAIGENRKNRLFRFSFNKFSGLVTELHSADGTIFETIFPLAKDIVPIIGAMVIA